LERITEADKHKTDKGMCMTVDSVCSSTPFLLLTLSLHRFAVHSVRS